MSLPASFKNVKFTDIDTNGSAYITFGEFRTAVKNHDANACDNAIFALFQKFCNKDNQANKVKINHKAAESKSFIVFNSHQSAPTKSVANNQIQPVIKFYYSPWQKLPVYFPTLFQEGGEITYSASYDKSMINPSEFYLMMADQFPPPQVKFEDIDTNGSGFISFNEFSAFVAKLGAEEGVCEDLVKAQTTLIWNKYCNAVNDGKGNDGTLYSIDYDKVRLESILIFRISFCRN